MNTLSWLLYFADAADSAKLAMLFAALATVPIGVISFLWTDRDDREAWDNKMADHRGYKTLYPNPPNGERPDISHPYRKLTKPIVITLVVLAALMTIIPGRNTVYAIAASEMGERALATPTASKAVVALNAWLDRQIQPPEAAHAN